MEGCFQIQWKKPGMLYGIGEGLQDPWPSNIGVNGVKGVFNISNGLIGPYLVAKHVRFWQQPRCMALHIRKAFWSSPHPHICTRSFGQRTIKHYASLRQ